MAVTGWCKWMWLGLGVCLLVSCSDKPVPPAVEPPAGSISSPSAKPVPGALTVLDVAERERNGKNGIAVTLSAPLATTANLQPYFTLQTAAGAPVDGAWVLGDNAKQVWFMNVEPEQAYRVRVAEGLSAATGESLAAPRDIELTTRALRPSVTFASQGSVLPAGYAAGLPVVTINVAAVDVDFFRVRAEALAQFLAQTRDYGHASWAARYLTAQAELTHSARFELNPAKNTRTRLDLPLAAEGLKAPGVYLAIMREPGHYDDKEITWFVLSDIGLHLRQYQNTWRVQANSLQSGAPLAGVAIRFLNQESQLLVDATTDAQGAAEVALQPQATTVTAQLNTQFTFVDLRQSALDLSEFDLGKRPQLPQELFLYGPRDLYRPGETLTVAGLIRDGDGRLGPAPVLDGSIRAPDGRVLKEFKWRPQEAGYYQLDWSIPAEAATGRWQVHLAGALPTPQVYPFFVEEFLPERLQVYVGSGRERTLVTDPRAAVKVPLQADYLYGAPAAGNRASAFYQAELWREPLESLPGYQFGHLLEAALVGQTELPDQPLDAEGHGEWLLASQWGQSQSPLALRVTASVYENGGRAVTRSHKWLLWPAEALPAIRPGFAKDTNPQANSQVNFELASATATGELRAAEFAVTLMQEDRQYFWEYNDHEGWHWSWTEKEFPVASQTLSVPAGGPATLSLPVDWGRYRLEVTDTATGHIASVRFFAGHDWYYDWQNAGAGASRPDKINLALDKPAYQAGDTAQLQILPPSAGTVLVTVEGDALLWSGKLAVPAEGASLALPIGDHWQRHDLYVTAMMVQPIGTTTRITPKRALGLLHLPLERTARRLPVTINAPAKVRPAQKVAVQLQLPADARSHFVTLAAVDVGVLNISDFKTPDPFAYFFGQRRYSTELTDMYGAVIEYQQSPLAKQRFGGDADLARGGARPQTDVQIVSLFAGPVKVSASGEATVDLEIPDFNGRLRLMALAFGNERVGAADTEMTVAAPIVAEAALPRFLAYGDTGTLAIDLQNMTEAPATLTANLALTGAVAFAKGAKTAHSVTLAPGQKTTLRLPLTAVAALGRGQIELRLTSDAHGESVRQWTLGVRPAYPAVTVKKAPVLQRGEALTFGGSDLAGVIEGSLQGSVAASDRINLNLHHHLQALLEYPYGCLEQTTSRAAPLLTATEAAQSRLGLPVVADHERLAMLSQAIERVASFAKAGGGFGLWGEDGPEEHWLTVFATDFLLQARDQGLDVPPSLLESATTRLTYYLQSQGGFIDTRYSAAPKHYAFATRAYAAYVLARVNLAPLGALRSLYARDFNHAATGLAQTHLGLALLAAGDRKTANEALARAVAWQPGERPYLGDYGSEVRDLAQMVALLLNHDERRDDAARLALLLRERLHAREWLSTQERSALFAAGLALEGLAGKPWQAELSVGATPETLNVEGDFRRALPAPSLAAGVRLVAATDGPIYVEGVVSGYTKNPPAPVDQGIHIARNWYNTDGKLITPATVRTGELLLVHLALSSSERLPDALVVNLLPAGLELENQNLEHAIALDDFKIDGQPLAELRQQADLKHQQYRDDRYVAALALHPHTVSHLFFLARAVTPGSFQVPPAFAEDMYRPEIRGLGETFGVMTVNDR